MAHSTRYHYDRFSGCTSHSCDDSALLALAKAHLAKGVYDESCAVTGDEKAVYRSFYKDLGGNIKAGVAKRKALESKRLVAA